MSRFGGPTMPPGQVADITMILEGTYPFVRGGVSSWVHQIIRGLPQVKFSLIFIGGSPDQYEKMRYELPPNVLHLEEHFLADVPSGDRVLGRRGHKPFYDASDHLHDAFVGRTAAPLGEILNRVSSMLLENPQMHEQDFLFSERAWDQICKRYEAQARDRSFLEYFWTVRSMHAPLFVMAKAAAKIPPTRAFHVISTGFAGFLAALASKANKRPLILTEHGIYTKERRIELLQATWITDDDSAEGTGLASIGYFRQLWIRFFEALGKMTYEAALPIIALYEGNRERQIRDGAPQDRTTVVPNGIDLERLGPLVHKRAPGVPKILALIGRVVPIKDIKTFIRAMRIVVNELPDAEGWIVGPEDEDPNYAEECHSLVESLDLKGKVKFLGFQNILEIFPQIGLNILTSISEAQPLVVLEGFAAGVPSVASDVGCCRELIEGVSAEDKALGHAGGVVDIADPESTARVAIDLLGDEAHWRAAQRAGLARVERYYTQRQMLERYYNIYRGALGI